MGICQAATFITEAHHSPRLTGIAMVAQQFLGQSLVPPPRLPLLRAPAPVPLEVGVPPLSSDTETKRHLDLSLTFCQPFP